MKGLSRFTRVLLLIVFAALALRVGYVLTVTRHDTHFYDAAYYSTQAHTLADGRGFVDPFAIINHVHVGPAADHPPLTSIVLVPAALVSHDDLVMRFEMVALGLAVVVLIGLLGRALVDERVGLIAAGIAAISPNLWMNDGLIMSETIATLLTVIALLLAYRVIRQPSLWLVAALGVVCGLATLTRAELALFVPLLALPAAWISHRSSRRALLQAVGATVVAAGVVVAPWVVFNLTRFDAPAFISTNDGIALLGSNCDDVYYGHGIGLTSLACLGKKPPGDQAEQSRVYRDRALDYVGDHAGRAPLVALARVGRLWSVWNPSDTIEFNRGEGRPEWASTLGVVTLFLLVIGAGFGIVALRRRKVAVWPLLVPVFVVTVSAALFYGQPRFRSPAEPTIVVLAAIGIGLFRRQRSGETPDKAPDQAPGSGASAIEASSSS
jgi:4-amino-4-deoxy-L-arabinose transferase-like glycosyltransferase